MTVAEQAMVRELVKEEKRILANKQMSQHEVWRLVRLIRKTIDMVMGSDWRGPEAA